MQWASNEPYEMRNQSTSGSTVDCDPDNPDFYVVTDKDGVLGPNQARILVIEATAIGRDESFAAQGGNNGHGAVLIRRASFRTVNYKQTDSTLPSGVTDADTTIPYSATDLFQAGDVIQLEDEAILVGAVSSGGAGGTLTGCTRGYNGTTAAAHAISTPIFFAPFCFQMGAPVDVYSQRDPTMESTNLTFLISNGPTVISVIPQVTGDSTATLMDWFTTVHVRILTTGLE